MTSGSAGCKAGTKRLKWTPVAALSVVSSFAAAGMSAQLPASLVDAAHNAVRAGESSISRGEYTDCRPTTTPLVFDGGYRVSMCYETAAGAVGEAKAGIWASGQSGLLWFFDRDNAEVLVKVLNGCSHNGRRWVFVAPVTDVAFNLHVTSSGGRQWIHRNRLGETASTRSDTSAFVCADDDALPDAVETGAQTEKLTEQALAESLVPRGEYTDCRPTTAPLVFDGGYQVSLCYQTAEGAVGEARAGIWASNQSGLLWFFDRGNAEVLVKVLDGCLQNGHRWIFVAPVTDVAFNLHVTSSGGRQWTHRNSLGATAATRSDTSAFVCNAEDEDAEGIVPDPGLRSAIRAALDLPGTASITPAHLRSLSWLSAEDKGIRDLTGLEFAKNLKSLNLWSNAVTDLSPLAGLTKLERLVLWYNSISDISPLKGLTGLRDLGLWCNQITELGPLRSLAGNLTRLNVGCNPVSDLSLFREFVKLVDLDISSTNVSDLSFLDPLARLRKLELRNLELAELPSLRVLARLEELGFAYNNATDFSPLEGLANLKGLDLRGNAIVDASFLAGLTNLTALSLGYNAITDVSFLAGLTNLDQFLNLRNNGITDVSPLAGLTKLDRFLDLRNNGITDVSPLAGLTELDQLALGYNFIADVSPLAGLTELPWLDLAFNEITDVSPLAGLDGLRYLGLRGNLLDVASLDVHVPALVRRGVDVQFDAFRKKGEFDIDLVFLGDGWSGFDGRHARRETEWAARRWMAVVSDDLPNQSFSQGRSGTCGESSWEISPGERIDDLRVYVASFAGGPGDPLGWGGPSLLRDGGFPSVGCVVLDLERGNIPVLASHELGHVLGIGTTWHDLVRTSGDPHFSGPLAVAAFDDAGGVGYAGAKVPLRSASDTGHWRVPVLQGELMGPFGGGALSAITVQALADIGYGVDAAQADAYTLPNGAAASGGSRTSGASDRLHGVGQRWGARLRHPQQPHSPALFSESGALSIGGMDDGLWDNGAAGSAPVCGVGAGWAPIPAVVGK